jgi:hypothetical protein
VHLTWRVCRRINGPQAKARKAPLLATVVRHNRLFDSVKDEGVNIPVKVRHGSRRPRQSLHDLETAALAPCMLHCTVCSIGLSPRVVEVPVLTPAVVWYRQASVEQKNVPLAPGQDYTALRRAPV